MSFTTLTARFPGTCKRCKQPIAAGERIRYGGKGLTYHLADDCQPAVRPSLQSVLMTQPQPEPVKMTPALAQTIRQTFDDLLSRPVTLADFDQIAKTAQADQYPGVLDSPEDRYPEPQEQFTFTTIAGATVKTVPQPARPASIDADLF